MWMPLRWGVAFADATCAIFNGKPLNIWATQSRTIHFLRMEFRTLVQRIIMVPAQILRSGRTLVYRLLAWRPELPVLFRFLDAL